MKMKNLKWVLMLFAAVLTLGLYSCSDDDGPNGGGSGKGDKMTGWVEIDGKKYDLKYCYDAKEESQSGDNSFIAASTDIDKKKPTTKRFNIAYVGLFESSNGNISQYHIEFLPDFGYFEPDVEGYYAGEYQNISSKVSYSNDNGVIKFDGNDIVFHKMSGEGDELGTVTGSFHFEGKPSQLKNATFE